MRRESDRFATTHWSIVLAAGRDDAPEARQAMDSLCRVYWYPLYAYVRRLGYGSDDAQDSVQGFFTRLIEKGDVAMATLWAAHDRAARDLLPVWHGREIDKTDGMLLLFDAASDAVWQLRQPADLAWASSGVCAAGAGGAKT